MSDALKLFESTLKRSSDIFTLAAHWFDGCPEDKHHKQNKPVYEDMGRSGIVFAVAAMDTYFTRRFVEVLMLYLRFRGPTEGVVTLLHDAGLDTRLALELLSMERPYRRIRALVDGHLERYTTQRFQAIDKLFVALGLKDLCANAQKKSGRATLLRSVELLVERRHAIVHNGDHDKFRRIIPLVFKEYGRRIGDLERFVTSADAIITSLEKQLK